jgi:hypothetical protein
MEIIFDFRNGYPHIFRNIFGKGNLKNRNGILATAIACRILTGIGRVQGRKPVARS